MQLQQLLEAMIAYMGGDARRIQHFIKVHALAQLIGRQEQNLTLPAVLPLPAVPPAPAFYRCIYRRRTSPRHF